MSIFTELKDGRGTSNLAKITNRGQLVVSSLDFSESYTVTAALTGTAYNFVPPISGKRFIVTDILLYADKNVGANDASVQIYEADSLNETTIDKTILDIEMVKKTSRDMTGLNLIISESRWLNIKTNDNIIYATVMGYYVTA